MVWNDGMRRPDYSAHNFALGAQRPPFVYNDLINILIKKRKGNEDANALDTQCAGKRYKTS